MLSGRDVTAARIWLEWLEKHLVAAIAMDRNEVWGGFVGAGPPANLPRATAQLRRFQSQQRQGRLQRQTAFLAQRKADAPRPRGRREPRAAPPVRRQRTTSATRRGPPDDPSSGSGGDEPPLDGVTDSGLTSRPCEVCGERFTPQRRSDARLCGSACKQKAYRLRRKQERIAALETAIEPAVFLEAAGGDPLLALDLAIRAPEIRRALEAAA